MASENTFVLELTLALGTSAVGGFIAQRPHRSMGLDARQKHLLVAIKQADPVAEHMHLLGWRRQLNLIATQSAMDAGQLADHRVLRALLPLKIKQRHFA